MRAARYPSSVGKPQHDVIEIAIAIGRPELDQPGAVVGEARPHPATVRDLDDRPGRDHGCNVLISPHHCRTAVRARISTGAIR